MIRNRSNSGARFDKVGPSRETGLDLLFSAPIMMKRVVAVAIGLFVLPACTSASAADAAAGKAAELAALTCAKGA